MTASESSRDDPATDLGAVWDALDVLPRGSASALLAATTVELAAVADAAAGAGWRRAGAARPLAAAAVVAAALGAGILVGHGTAPDTDQRILEVLPIVRHLDLLQDAGSVRFLEELHRRGVPPPPRLMSRQNVADRAAEREQFMEEVATLRAALNTDSADGGLAARREAVQALPSEERVDLVRAAERYGRLTRVERRSLETVARAISDPGRQDLRDAALVWRQWLDSMRPAERPAVVAEGAEKRLAWLDWHTRRLEGRGPERVPRGPDPWSRRMRPEFPVGPPGSPRLEPADAPAPRGPRREGRPPFRPDAPHRPEPRADAAETPAPPR